MYRSDWHIHTEGSYDARKKDFISPPELLEQAHVQGIKELGISDHVNVNTPSYYADIELSRRLYDASRTEGFHFGVELTPVERPLFDYAAQHGTAEGYERPTDGTSLPFELALSEEQIASYGIEYVIGAAHCALGAEPAQASWVREWHRLQMQIASDPRVDILGHPWWAGIYWKDPALPELKGMWFLDFSVVPFSMHDELASALLARDCCAEMNYSMIAIENYGFTDKFRTQYLEFLRYLFERGVRITYGSDLHSRPYADRHQELDEELRAVGFREGDFSEPKMRKY